MTAGQPGARIRAPAVAGTFYPAGRGQLKAELAALLADAHVPPKAGLAGVVGLVLAVADPIVNLLAVPLWILGSLGFARLLYGTLVARREAQHLELVRELGATVQAALDAARGPATARVRVAESASSADDAEESDAAQATPAPRGSRPGRAKQTTAS